MSFLLRSASCQRESISGDNLSALMKREAYKNFSSYGSTDSSDSGVSFDLDSALPHQVEDENLLMSHLLDLHLHSTIAHQVKKLLRKGGWPLHHDVRKQLWILLCRDKNYDSMRSVYESKLQEETSSSVKIHHPLFVREEGAVLNNFELNEDGAMRLLRLLGMVENDHPTLTSAPFLYPLCALLLHFMSDTDAYACTEYLLRKRRWGARGPPTFNGYIDERSRWERKNAPMGFLIKSTKEWYASAYTVLALIKKHKSSAYTLLKRRCNTTDDSVIVETMRDYLQWIFRGLPLTYVVRVMDCYLVEGQKFILRAAIAIVYIWAKSQKDSNTDRYGGMGQQERIRAVKEEIMNTAKGCEISADTFIETCIRIRNLKSSTIQRFQEHFEKQVASEVEAKVSKAKRPSKARLFTDAFQSVIVDPDQASYIMQSLPARLQLSTPQLLFRLSKDGASFTQLWTKVDEADQSLLIIKSIKGEVLGAYCSASWSERNDRKERSKSKYFGTGESFVFRVDKNDIADLPIIYQWVGNSSDEPDKAPQMFMAAGDRLMIVGSGTGDAIRISEELSCGMSGQSATFGSPPLVDSRAFDIHELEVFNVSSTQ
ncbi:unnamed protein product, partial [Mesorhabditis belari]|uniref:TBC1 domain family member 24 n=1 Tax=Mesorhabditis belari TaxID=2138241 RepID=A0AAF3E8W1_9BILA